MVDTMPFEHTFEYCDFFESDLPDREFEDCAFIKCTIPDNWLEHKKLFNCVFEHCDLSMAKLNSATLNNVQFRDCKMIGVDFTACNDFLFITHYESCMLDYANFSKKDLKHTTFNECEIKDAIFTEANLTGAKFLQCNLVGTVFNRTILTKADFRTAYNFSIDPEQNTVKKAKFSRFGLAGLLETYDLTIE